MQLRKQVKFALAKFSPAILFFGCACFSFTSRAAKAAEHERTVVVISVDGLAAFYYDDPKAEMPNIRAIAKSGARASSMQASAPSVTWPNHTTLVTGVTPARHGVVGNRYFDRATGKPVALIGDPVYDKDQIVKVPTIYDVAHEQGMKTAAIRWPATRNAKTLDWATPDGANNVDVLMKYTTPSLLEECRAASIWPAELGERKCLSDATVTQIFQQVLTKHQPRLGFLHLIDVDHFQHEFGPRTPEVYAVIKASDEQVGVVWNQLKRDFPGKATLIIVSDHGFSSIQHSILANVVLRKAGLLTTSKKKVNGGNVRVVIQGGSAFVYVLDEQHREQICHQVAESFQGIEGVESICGPGHLKEHGMAEPSADPHAPDVVLFAKEGYAFSSDVTGDSPISDAVEKKGTHGHDEHLPHLHATFVAWGDGIKAGAELGEIRNVDVAPTIAKLLSLPLPGTDGHVLKEALSE